MSGLLRQQIAEARERDAVDRRAAAREAGRDLVGSIRSALGIGPDGRRPVADGVGVERDESGRFIPSQGLDGGRQGTGPVKPAPTTSDRNRVINHALRISRGVDDGFIPEEG
jgi:hypothetical protein